MFFTNSKTPVMRKLILHARLTNTYDKFMSKTKLIRSHLGIQHLKILPESTTVNKTRYCVGNSSLHILSDHWNLNGPLNVLYVVGVLGEVFT